MKFYLILTCVVFYISLSFVNYGQTKDTVLITNTISPRQIFHNENDISQTFDNRVSTDSNGNYVLTLKNKGGLEDNLFSVNYFNNNDSLIFQKKFYLRDFINFRDSTLIDATANLTDDGEIIVLYAVRSWNESILKVSVLSTDGSTVIPVTTLKEIMGERHYDILDVYKYGDNYVIQYGDLSSNNYGKVRIEQFSSDFQTSLTNISITGNISSDNIKFISRIKADQLRIVYSEYDQLYSKTISLKTNTTISENTLAEDVSNFGDFNIGADNSNYIIYSSDENDIYQLILKRYSTDFSQNISTDILQENNEFEYGSARIFNSGNDLLILYIAHIAPEKDQFYWGTKSLVGPANFNSEPFESNSTKKSIEHYSANFKNQLFKLFYTDTNHDRSYTYFQKYEIPNHNLSDKIMLGHENPFTDFELDVAQDSAGNYLAVWANAVNNSSINIQRFNQDLQPVGHYKEIFTSEDYLMMEVRYLSQDKFRILWYDFTNQKTDYYSALYSFSADSIIQQVKLNSGFTFQNSGRTELINVNDDRHLFLTSFRGDTVAVEEYDNLSGNLRSVLPININSGVISVPNLGSFLFPRENSGYFVIWGHGENFYSTEYTYREINDQGIPVSESKILVPGVIFENYSTPHFQYIGNGKFLFFWTDYKNNQYQYYANIVDTASTTQTNRIDFGSYTNPYTTLSDFNVLKGNDEFVTIYRSALQPLDYYLQVFDLDRGAYGGAIDFFNSDSFATRSPSVFYKNNLLTTFYLETDRETRRGKFHIRQDMLTYNLVTGIVDNAAPNDYHLAQNYPNPFNPSTRIKFAVPVDSKVTVTLYNMLGQKVKEIVSQNYSVGLHEVNFNASELSSGMYIYSITAQGVDGSNFFDTKKIMLLK
ncbi:MAG: hypothetical protein SCALA702_18990 [Melioribacteraceae bacterium]|nr:MAG: hypothetical protein SCALA702_18990 [Melioribacteraceae bacterium]